MRWRKGCHAHVSTQELSGTSTGVHEHEQHNQQQEQR